MTNIITQRIERIGRHPAAVGTMTFLRWWRNELLDSLPEQWRAHLHMASDVLLVRADADHLVLADGSGEELGRFPRDADADAARQTVHEILETLDDEQPEILAMLDAGRVLRRTITVPAAAADNLRQVLGFEMDRYTPFKPEDVHFDYRVEEEIAGGAKLRVSLFLVRRTDSDAVVDLCRQRGLVLSGIDATDDGGERLGINLLPPDQRPPRDRRQLQWNLALAALFIVLLNVVLWQSVSSRETAMDDYQQRLSTVRAEAAEVIALRGELESAAAAASFLADRKRGALPVMDLLGELTRRLPDDTWLQRMQINGNTVQVSGQAPAAAQLVELLEASGCLESPNIKGAVTPDPQSGKERFTIEATIKAGRCDGPASS
ncbi:MAG: PilN domain-containing protein [Pseudomonadota bacterium]